MTILLPNKILHQPRDLLWRTASQFEQASRWVVGVEKTEHVSGQAANVGGVWRVHWHWAGSFQVIEFEITEWLEGERIGLRPLNMSVVKSDTELCQIVLNLKGLADRQTLVNVQYEYEPRHRLAKIKNLMFLRRRYLQRVEASLATLERVAGD